MPWLGTIRLRSLILRAFASYGQRRECRGSVTMTTIPVCTNTDDIKKWHRKDMLANSGDGTANFEASGAWDRRLTSDLGTDGAMRVRPERSGADMAARRRTILIDRLWCELLAPKSAGLSVLRPTGRLPTALK